MVDSPDTYSPRGLEQGELLALNDTGKELVGTLERLEQDFGDSKTPKASEFIRATDYKVGAFERNSTIDQHTKELYEALLKKHLNNIDKPITTQTQYLTLSRGIVSDMKDLKVKDGDNISNKRVDAGIVEGIEAVYDGTAKGLEVAVNELKKQLETLISPEEWQKIVDALISIAKDPIRFMDKLIQGLKTEAKDVWKQVEVMWKNSTNSGFSAEMGRYIPEVGVPMLIGTIGPGKFFKILGLDRILPESIMRKFIKEPETLYTPHNVDTRSVEKLRGMKLSQIQYVLDGEINTMKTENLRTIYNGVQKGNDGIIPVDRKLNRLSNEWLGTKLGNVDNVLTVAVERNNPIMKKKIRDEVLLPIANDMTEAERRGVRIDPTMDRTLKIMLKKAE